MSSSPIPNDVTVQAAPTPQLTIDLFDGWTSKLPDELDVKAGQANLFNDPRTHWALNLLGSVEGQSVLELGPLEGGHTYMLHEAGASVTSIEANKRGFLKCLIVKELLKLDRARFLLGNFVPWLAAGPHRFDLVWATGILYHMSDPLELLRLIAACTDRVHIWTHYVPDTFDPSEAWAAPILRVEEREVAGRHVQHYVRSYLDTEETPQFCGGTDTTSVWLRRADILDGLTRLGLSRIDVAFDTTAHPHGPCFALVATRPR
jgi:hypothetical protein